MKKHFNLILAILMAVVLASCEKNSFDYPEGYVGVSKITTYPTFTMNGQQYVSVVKGGTYTDPGVEAKEGTSTLTVTKTGTVNFNTVGVYDITYTAVNKDGFSGSVTRTIAVLPSAEASGVDISGTYDYATGGGASVITKLDKGFYLTSNVYSPASVMPAYIITVDGLNLTVPLASLSAYGPVRGTGTISATGALTYRIDVLNYGISQSTRRWQKR